MVRLLLLLLCVAAFPALSLSIDEEPMTPAYLYKIVSPEDWKEAQNTLVVPKSAIDTQFFHLAAEEQVAHVVKKFWCKADKYVLLKLDVAKLKGTLKYETNPGGVTKYYHLYEGEIPLDAVVDAKTISNQEKCSCHSSVPYGLCCGLYHHGIRAPNAEALMRSRYCAYALKMPDYIIQTTHPQNPHFMADKLAWTNQILDFCTSTLFQGLRIHSFQDGLDEAFVTFTAILKQNGRDASFKEKSRFLKVNERWFYLDRIA